MAGIPSASDGTASSGALVFEEVRGLLGSGYRVWVSWVFGGGIVFFFWRLGVFWGVCFVFVGGVLGVVWRTLNPKP